MCLRYADQEVELQLPDRYRKSKQKRSWMAA
jgi:hypothetical protein